MPLIIKAAAIKVFEAIAGNAVLSFFAQVAGTLIISNLTEKLFGKKARKPSLAGIQTTARGSLEPRKILYGQGKIGGVVTYNNVRDVDNKFQDVEIVYLDHRAEAISFFIDEKEILVADIAWTPAIVDSTAGVGTGNVTSAPWVNNAVNALRIQWQVGFDNQPANAGKVGNYIEQTAAHQLRGTFNAIFSLLYTEDTNEIWSGGTPQRLNVLAKGKPIFDRRRYALNADNTFATATKKLGGLLKWFGNAIQTILPSTGFDTFSVAAGTLTVTDNDDTQESIFSERFPVDTSKRYTVTAKARQTAGDRRNHLLVAFYDSAGNNIVASTGGATGWASLGTYHYYDIVNAVFTGAFVVYEIDFGSGGTASIPAGAVTMSCGALLTQTGAVGTATTIDIQDMAIYEDVLANRHDPVVDTTWTYHDNPANCLADYLTQYMGADIDEDIDWSSVIVAAQACDVVVNIPGTPSTEKRFTCNGGLFTDQDHENVLEQLKECMGGLLVWTGGKWHMRAGVYAAPTETIESTWLAGPVSVQGSAPSSERYNIIEGNYIDPTRDYESVQFSPATLAAFVTRDGGKELPFDISLQFVNSEYLGQRLAIRKLEQFDNQKTLTILSNAKGAKVLPGTQYSVTLSEFSFTAKVFRAIGWTPTPDGNFECTFKEDFASRYNDPLVGEYTTKTAAGAIVPPTRTVTPPNTLTAVGKSGLIELSWVNPPPSLFDYIEVWRSTTNDVATATKIAETRASVYIDYVSNTTPYFYWNRAKAFTEKFSLYEPNTTAGVAGTAADGGLGQPGSNVKITDYDDLDTTQLAAGGSRYAMLTARGTNTSGSQNNFHLTDAILINKADFDGTNWTLFFSTLEVGDRITFYVNDSRFFIFDVDETFQTVGTGAAEAYKFGVSLVDSLDPSPTDNISTSAGTSVQFQFNRTPTNDGSLLEDSDFDFSSSLPTATDESSAGFWDNISHWIGLKKMTAPSSSPSFANWGWTFNSGTGPNNSNTIGLVTAIPITSGFTEAWLVGRKRVRTNTPSFDMKLRILNEDPVFGDIDLQIKAIGYDSPTSQTTQLTIAKGFKLLYTDGITYDDLEFHLEAASDTDAQYWEFRIGFRHIVVVDIGECVIDSMFVYPVSRSFGANTFQDEGAGNQKFHAGQVPEADAVTDAGKVLDSTGNWVSNAGAATLGGLSDVNLAGALDNDLLYRSGGNWINTGGLLTWDGSNLSATNIGGILEANLLDKTAAEVISGAWDFSATVELISGTNLILYDSAGLDTLTLRAILNAVEIEAASVASMKFKGATLEYNFDNLVRIASGGLSINAGAALNIIDSLATDSMSIAHDGTDITFTHTNTTDWNITGITAIQAGTVDADFDALTATSYGGILEANLLDKTAAETITASWTFSAQPTFTSATGLLIDSNTAQLGIRQSDASPDNKRWRFLALAETFSLETVNDLFTITTPVFTVDRTATVVDSFNVLAPLTATSYNGVLAANLLDKTAAEIISGLYAHTAEFRIAAGEEATLSIDKTGAVGTRRFKLFVGDSTSFIADENYIACLNTGLHILTGSTGTDERVTVLQGGNVGIGTATPEDRLTVKQGINNRFINLNTGAAFQDVAFGLDNTRDPGRVDLIIETEFGDGVFTERVRLTNQGNFGIGTADPADKLDVNGAIISTSSAVRTGNIVLGHDLQQINKLLKSVATAHLASNVPSELSLIFNDGASSGVRIKNTRTGSFNSQAIHFDVHEGGIAFRADAMVIDFTGAVDVVGAFTAASYGGILEANLLDKTATETITELWTFDGKSIRMGEQAADLTTDAGFGRLWTLNSSPTELHFTDDNGSTHHVAGGSLSEVFGTDKTADETVTNSTVLQDDNHLFLETKAGFTYLVELWLRPFETFITSSTGFKWDFVIPASAFGDYTYSFWQSAGDTNPSQKLVGNWTADQSISSIDSSNNVVHIQGIIHTPTAGTFKLRWACAVAPGPLEKTILQKRSNMTIIQT